MKLLSREKLVKKLKESKEFRDAFAMEFVKNSIPSQLRDLRDQRKWTQEDLGKATKKPRNVITRLENPNNNIPNIYTMLEMAWGVEAALLVKIIPFSDLLREYSDDDLERFYAASISDKKEVAKLSKWIDEDEPEIHSGTSTEASAKLLNEILGNKTATSANNRESVDFTFNSEYVELSY